MKRQANIMTILLSVILMAFMGTVQSIYFYMEPGQERCFKDEVVKNYVSNLIILREIFIPR